VGEGAGPEHTTVTERLLVLTSAAFLLCCSGEPLAPAPTGSAPGGAQSPAKSTTVAAPSEPTSRGEGRLEVSSGQTATSFLGSLHAVVTDAAGEVLGGADEDIAFGTSDGDHSLSLVLPAGEGYTVSLTASTSDVHPTTCKASLAALRIDAGSTARAQVFSWDCGGVSGYVPQALQTDCYWLADWSFVTRTSAAIGQLINVSAAGHDLDGNLPKFSWSTSSPELGSFDDPAAARTAFRCAAAGENLPLTVLLDDGNCAQQITQTVACR
jgi:hypothetical protein